MATKLPKISIPTYRDKLISNGQDFKYRSFLVGEESKLLLLKEGLDDDITNTNALQTIKELIDDCTFNELDVDNLPQCDIEWIFLQLRKKSVGEVIDLIVNHGSDSDCDHKQRVSINLDNVEIERDQKVNDTIVLDPQQNIGIKLRYPTYSDLENIETKDKASTALSLIKLCTEYIFQGKELFYLTDFSTTEVDEFFAGCSSAEQLKQIVSFFESAPKIVYHLKWECDKCKKEDEVKLEGLQTFL